MSERRSLSQLTKNEVLRRQKHLCAMCNEPFGELGVTPHYDHIKRVESRGTNKPENIQALCPNCHEKKTHKELLKKAGRQKKPKFDPIKKVDKQMKKVDRTISKRLKGLI